MTLIAYTSRTGNVRRFVGRLGLPSVEIERGTRLDEPFVLVTYTTGFGEVPAVVDVFLRNNSQHLRGVAASGNRNWGANFALAADKIAAQYGVPIAHKFELSGMEADVNIFCERVAMLGDAKQTR